MGFDKEAGLVSLNFLLVGLLWVYAPLYYFIAVCSLSLTITSTLVVQMIKQNKLKRPYLGAFVLFIVNLVATPLIGLLFLIDKSELEDILEINFG